MASPMTLTAAPANMATATTMAAPIPMTAIAMGFAMPPTPARKSSRPIAPAAAATSMTMAWIQLPTTAPTKLDLQPTMAAHLLARPGDSLAVVGYQAGSPYNWLKIRYDGGIAWIAESLTRKSE